MTLSPAWRQSQRSLAHNPGLSCNFRAKSDGRPQYPAFADHLTAAQFLKSELGGQVGIGQGIRGVQEHFARVFNLQVPYRADGHQFDLPVYGEPGCLKH